MEPFTFPQLLGVRIENAPPIKDLFLKLEAGLLVLYGRNGAGKTRILDGIAESMEGGDSGSTSTLVFEWPPPQDISFEDQLDHMDEALRGRGSDWIDRTRWNSLPGNPWSQQGFFPRTLGAELLRHDAKDVLGDARIEDVLGRLGLVVGGASEGSEYGQAVQQQAMRILLAVEPAQLRALRFESPTQADADVLASNVLSALQIAQAGRFAIRRGHRGEGGQLLTISPVVGIMWPLIKELFEGENRESLSRPTVERDPQAWMVERSLEDDLGMLITRAESLMDMALGRPLAPDWFGDTYLTDPHEGQSPAVLVRERPDLDLVARALHFVEHRLNPPLPPRNYFDYQQGTSQPRPERKSGLLRSTQDGFVISPEAIALVAEVSETASKFFGLLLERAPLLEARLNPIQLWPLDGVLAWVAIDPTGAEVALNQLSNAQSRWASFAIQLATLDHSELPLVILLDEPEAALHRRAERHLVAGLTRLSVKLNAHIVAATHSPAFLQAGAARLVHVHRGAGGSTEAEPMERDVRTRIGELGLDAADLLQFCRAILLVEGQHELVVLEALLGDSLRELGIEMMCMRGATTLKTWDAQMIERFTDAPIVVLVDNDQAERLHDVWRRACSAAAAGEPYFEIIDELKSKGRGSEGEFLRELCKNLITKQQPERYHISAFDKADIPEYLALHDIAPEAPLGATWDDLKRRPYGKSFKPWMEKTFNADYSDENLRNAALHLDAIPDDFARLLDFLRAEVLNVE